MTESMPRPGILALAGPRGDRGPARRLLIDNDWAGDPDGLVALAHHLLSTDRVVAITSSRIAPIFPGADVGATKGVELVERLLVAIDPVNVPDIAAGRETPFVGDGHEVSDAARLIIDHALRDGELPLTLVCAGPLSNVAEALRQEPEVARRVRLVWVGGAIEDTFEYNRDTDREAAELVFASDIAIEQFPLETYRRCTYSIAELEAGLTGSVIGDVLWDAFAQLPIPPEMELGELWHLGDSLPLLVTSLSPSVEPRAEQRVVHTDVDFRLLVEDMRAKLTLHERRRRASALNDEDRA